VTAATLQSRLKKEGRVLGILAAFAVIVSLATSFAQVMAVAAPLWKGGAPTAETLSNVARQVLLVAPAVLYVLGLRRALGVFRRMGSGEIFARTNGEGLTATGTYLLAGAVWSMVVAGLDPATQDTALFQDHVVRNVGFLSADLALAAVGLALNMVGRVISAAARLKADNDGFV
jgi:hypothetical protein